MLHAHVPPQQHAWWAAAAQQASGLDKRLPRELVLSVMKQADEWPVSEAEARRLRKSSMVITSACERPLMVVWDTMMWISFLGMPQMRQTRLLEPVTSPLDFSYQTDPCLSFGGAFALI
jgi:hypothetical protein